MNIPELLSQMTIDEKASLCSGQNFWQTQEIERLNIPPVMMCDGPHGLRKQVAEEDQLGMYGSIKTVCYPTASALACSFDRELLGKLGETLGNECQAENVAMLLGPGANMKRSPLCGRNFEYFSEDPYLAGQIAAALIKGLQSKGVSCCIKHFAANNQESLRLTSDSRMDERTLREIYLTAFEIAVKEGGARGVMCAYNAINGVACSENKKILTDILRNEWGFKGMT
ncbi:MAG: glycoside hydrolase family 3 protein, partial [Parasporobacterium sp.]|nr:glycoside hydrolase family 3 protein [Parasporobacterium sp.]